MNNQATVSALKDPTFNCFKSKMDVDVRVYILQLSVNFKVRFLGFSCIKLRFSQIVFYSSVLNWELK